MHPAQQGRCFGPSEELTSVLKEMPRIDLGMFYLDLRPTLGMRLGKGLATRQIETKLRAQIGPNVAEAFSSYGRMLEAWIRRMLAELQRHFDAQADGYRAQLRSATISAGTTQLDEEALKRDLEQLEQLAVHFEAQNTARISRADG
jgi:hypothetical protein